MFIWRVIVDEIRLLYFGPMVMLGHDFACERGIISLYML